MKKLISKSAKKKNPQKGSYPTLHEQISDKIKDLINTTVIIDVKIDDNEMYIIGKLKKKSHDIYFVQEKDVYKPSEIAIEIEFNTQDIKSIKYDDTITLKNNNSAKFKRYGKIIKSSQLIED